MKVGKDHPRTQLYISRMNKPTMKDFVSIELPIPVVINAGKLLSRLLHFQETEYDVIDNSKLSEEENKSLESLDYLVGALHLQLNLKYPNEYQEWLKQSHDTRNIT